ncbi:hypothetical protein [Zoogloea sp.]|uniref:hypothetical protein n=1 Tax=Zoogloea sp. TaxID=49181 RepID=UPI0014164428|nr:MAG: hypothetical protein F9K15_16830 [Zoogloea sp.]
MSYIRAIHGKDSAVRIVCQALECSTWAEPDFEVRQEVTTYHFNNGVIVRRTLEEDSIASEAACTECWITYEVLPGSSISVNVQPSRRMFDSRCRESFWIRFHSEAAIGDDAPQ